MRIGVGIGETDLRRFQFFGRLGFDLTIENAIINHDNKTEIH